MHERSLVSVKNFTFNLSTLYLASIIIIYVVKIYVR